MPYLVPSVSMAVDTRMQIWVVVSHGPAETAKCTHPAENQEPIVPPQRPVPCHLAVHAQPEKDGRHNGHGPDGPQQHGRIVGYLAGCCGLGRVAARQSGKVHGAEEMLDPHGSERWDGTASTAVWRVGMGIN
jgi:hypothetical protein